MSISQTRRRLLDLTGSDEVRYNDPKYMQKLRKKVWQDYEAKLDKEEERRAEAERQRLRRLLAQGLISSEDMKEDSLLYKECHAHGHNTKNAKKKKKGQKKRSKSSQDLNNHDNSKTAVDLKASYSPRPPRESEGPTGSESGYTRSRSSARSHRSSPDAESQMSRMKTDMDNTDSGLSENEQSKDEEKTGASQSQSKVSLKSKKGEEPGITQLRHEETIAGLYDRAEDLVYTSTTSQPTKVR